MNRRWNRNEAFSTALPIDLWPSLNPDCLNPPVKEKYELYRKAMELYFHGETVREIQRKTGVHMAYLPYLARKCLELAEDGRIFGFRALVPHQRTAQNQRHAPIQHKRPEQQGGLTGALRMTLERFPDIEDSLVRLIKQEAKNREIPEKKIDPSSLHRIFINHLISKGVSAGEWPFNTKHRGIRTIQNFMNEVLDKNFTISVRRRGESAARAHLAVGTGITPFLNFPEPYDGVEIDAYHIDSFLTVAHSTPEGTETDLLLERLWLVAVVDRASTAVLSYRIVYRSEITSDDVVGVIRDAVMKRWSPKELTIPFTYPKEGGLPSGVIPQTYGACWSVTLMDGALAHLSKAVHERVRKTLGFVLTWGAVQHFERRPNVERTFGAIAKDIYKRLPSTTGSNPFNGRAENAEAKAIRHRIRAEESEQMLDVYLAQHNATPSEGLSFLSPLDFIRYFIENKSANFMLRSVPFHTLKMDNPFHVSEVVAVRGGRESGRRPYVQLDRVHYTSPVLSELGNLIGLKIRVEIDEDDFRQVKAFMPNGSELGFLTAAGRWGVTKHSRRTRKAINSLLHKRTIVLTEFDDPVQIYLQYLGAKKDVKAASPSPRQVTDITRVAREAGLKVVISSSISENLKKEKFLTSSSATLYRKSIVPNQNPFTRKVRNRK